MRRDYKHHLISSHFLLTLIIGFVFIIYYSLLYAQSQDIVEEGLSEPDEGGGGLSDLDEGGGLGDLDNGGSGNVGQAHDRRQVKFSLYNWVIKYPEFCPEICLSVLTYEELLECLETADHLCTGTVGIGPYGTEATSNICHSSGPKDIRHRIAFPNLINKIPEAFAALGLRFRNSYYGYLSVSFRNSFDSNPCEFYITPLFVNDTDIFGADCGLSLMLPGTELISHLLLHDKTIYIHGNYLSLHTGSWIGITTASCGSEVTRIHWDVQRVADWEGTYTEVEGSYKFAELPTLLLLTLLLYIPTFTGLDEQG